MPPENALCTPTRLLMPLPSPQTARPTTADACRDLRTWLRSRVCCAAAAPASPGAQKRFASSTAVRSESTPAWRSPTASCGRRTRDCERPAAEARFPDVKRSNGWAAVHANWRSGCRCGVQRWAVGSLPARPQGCGMRHRAASRPPSGGRRARPPLRSAAAPHAKASVTAAGAQGKAVSLGVNLLDRRGLLDLEL